MELAGAGTFGEQFSLTLLTADKVVAAQAERAGVQRIGIDIERFGKAARQAGHDTRLSHHTWDDLAAIASVRRSSELFVRLNPLHDGTEAEIQRAIDCGASVLMLPYFHSETEAADFARLVRRRAYTMLLVETPRAIVRIGEIAAVGGIDEIMVGLNDLRLQMSLRGFEFVASPLMETVSQVVRASGKRFSFGGLGRHDDGSLPIDPDLLYAQYPRLHATGAWLSRSFFKNPPPGWTLESGISSLRARLCFWAGQTEEELIRAQRLLALQSLGEPEKP